MRTLNRLTLAAVTAGIALVPQSAMAQDAGISGLMNFLVKILTNGMTLVGAALALAGLVGLGAGVWDIIQHFKPENRDNPDQKSRAVSGVVKFIMGGLLATGAYQTIANSEDFTASIDMPGEAVEVVAYSAPAHIDMGVVARA